MKLLRNLKKILKMEELQKLEISLTRLKHEIKVLWSDTSLIQLQEMFDITILE